MRHDGRAVHTDFGIASLDGDASLTRSGALIGSPAFMAPERARSEPGGPESDLWSLGAALYTLVEGRTPIRPRDGDGNARRGADRAARPAPRGRPADARPARATGQGPGRAA
ncbi:protein kinase domain-containing protein [Actinomadura sp. HBU206391]|uniref:protein kinase domain-containing protein n=1 Tax=Actinomadura sp. HBU206391 TaxID=2731692 RepID=UPI001C9C5CAC